MKQINSKQTNGVNADTLDFLLQVEAKASSMVTEAQEEADNRIRKNEEDLRYKYEESGRKEIQAQEKQNIIDYERVKNEYKEMLESYRHKLLNINTNKEQFRALINELIK